MFVGLMEDLRGTVTKQLFRVRVEQRPTMRMPRQGLSYSGPAGRPGSGVSLPGRPGRHRTARAPVPGGAPFDALGVAAASRVPAAQAAAGGGAATAATAGRDVGRLATNRGEVVPKRPVRAEKVPGRNAPCPCGSGRKYKKCHGRAN